MKSSRKKKGWTQDDLAIAVGMSRSAISNIEAGVRKPSVEAAKKIGQILSFDWTLFFAGNASK